jgi:PTS system galactitol-specific IIA component
MSVSQGLCTDHDLVILNFDAMDRKQVIKELGKKVLQKNLINEEFIDSVLAREEEFPTGLEMAKSIAIPHIGVFCNQSFLAFATLKKPVNFKSMDGSGKELPVEIVFLFGITNPSDQVEVLKKFITAFRKVESFIKLKEARNPVEAINLLNELMDNCLEIPA